MDKAALGVREPATLVGKPNPLGPLGKEDQEQKQKATLEEAGKEKVGGGAGGVSGVVAPDDEIALRNGEVASQRDETWERMRREAEEKEKEARGGGEGGKPDPWKQAARGGPSEAWQPQAWQPSPRPKK
jgi:NADH dehydrogenase [ubiquinone] 1 alpha subcomplex assembly factor 2